MTVSNDRKMEKKNKNKKEKKRKIEKISNDEVEENKDVNVNGSVVDGDGNGEGNAGKEEEKKELERRKLKNKRNKEKKKEKKKKQRDEHEDKVEQEEKVVTKKQKTEEKVVTKKQKKQTENNEDGNLTRFSQLKIVPELKQAINEAFDFGDTMTEIQRNSIPAALESSSTRDIIAQASTGSGKTIAFLIPVLARLCAEQFGQNHKRGKGHIGAVIMSPVRELALQIHEVAEKLLNHRAMKQKFGLQTGVIVGGVSKYKDMDVLKKAHLIVATPGRLADHVNSGNIDLQALRFFVLDEADMLIDQGFEREITDIVGAMPEKRTTMLFSATMSNKINELAVLSMRRDPIQIGFEKKKNVSTLEQNYVQVPAERKLAALVGILKKNQDKKIIIFVSIKKSVEFTTLLLNNLGIAAVELHGNIDQNKRTKTFRDFSNQENGILVATDVAARGLDIPDVDLVIQVDFPEQLAQYFHRAGRTARAGKAGTAVLMLNPAEVRNTLGVLKAHLMEDIDDKEEKLFEYKLPVDKNELDEFQQQVVDAVFIDPTLWRLADSIPRLYQMVFQMYRRKYGFRDSDFSLEAVQESFGFGNPSQDAKERKKMGADNNDGRFHQHKKQQYQGGGRNGRTHGRQQQQQQYW